MPYRKSCLLLFYPLMLLTGWTIGCATPGVRREAREICDLVSTAKSAAARGPVVDSRETRPVAFASAESPVESTGNEASATEPSQPSALSRSDSAFVEAFPPTYGDSPQWLEAFREYLIQPGDHLAIKFRVTPELNEEVTVRPDGKIALPLVGDVLAANRSPAELRGVLVGAYQSVGLREPEVAVIVRRFAGNQVFVGGEVLTPGSLALTGRTTTLQAIIQAGGFRDTADRRRVIVRRVGGGWEEFNLDAELNGRTVGQDIPLQAYDVVYVPKSRIATINQLVDQYITKVIPFQSSAGVFLSATAGGFNQAAVLGP